MRLVKILGAALVAVFAFSAMAATGASAHIFETSSAGLLVLASADGLQLFTTPAGHLACTTLTGDGIAGSIQSLLQLVTVKYTGCTVSVGPVTSKPDEPIIVQYLFSADELVWIENHVTILASLAGIKCNLLVLRQGPLSGVGYDNINSNTEILVLSHVKGILTSATGAGCAKTYTHNSEGLYRDNAFTKVDGGTTKWV